MRTTTTTGVQPGNLRSKKGSSQHPKSSINQSIWEVFPEIRGNSANLTKL